MSTISKEFTKEQLQQIIETDHVQCGEASALARIALASLEAEPVAWLLSGGGAKNHVSFDSGNAYADPLREVTPLYTAPPAPVSVPDESAIFDAAIDICRKSDAIDERAWNHGVLAVMSAFSDCRAAMLQGADTELQRKAAIHDALCEKYNVESLTDFVDWQRNHIAELEAAPPAPVGPGETAVMPDYPGYTMTQRECFDAGVKRAVPDGWVAVPVEPTEDMIVQGFESEPDESFSDEKEWEAYDAMSGCQQAAHRAKLCWAAMISAAPKSEMK